jgi:hypothetical protein
MEMFLEVDQILKFVEDVDNIKSSYFEQKILKRTVFYIDIMSFQEYYSLDYLEKNEEKKFKKVSMLIMNNGEEVLVTNKYVDLKNKIQSFYEEAAESE